MSLDPVLALYSLIVKKSQIAQTNKEKCQRIAEQCMSYSEVLKKINVHKIDFGGSITQLRCFQLEALALITEQIEEVCMNKCKNVFRPGESVRKFNLMEERLKYAHDEFILTITVNACEKLQRNNNLISRYHQELLKKLNNAIDNDSTDDAAKEYKHLLQHSREYFRHSISSQEYDSLIFAAEAKMAGNVDAEKEELERIIEQNPESCIGWFNLGYLLHTKKKDIERAKIAFGRSLEIDSKNADAWNNLGSLLVISNKFKEAERAFQKALNVDRTHVCTWNNLGQYYLKYENDIERAEKSFKEALELDPMSANIWNNLGNLLKKKEDLSGAAEAYKRSLELDPEYVRAWNNLGLLMSTRKNDIEGAKVFYEKALEIDPTNMNALKNLGRLLKREKKNLIRARSLFMKTIDVDPNDAECWYHLGNILKDTMDIEGSEAAFKKALTLDSKYSKAWKNLGDLLNKEKQDIDGAERAYKEAVKCNPGNARAWLNLGIVLEVKNDSEGAVAAHKRALEINPNISKSVKSVSEEKEELQNKRSLVETQALTGLSPIKKSNRSKQ